MLLNSHLLEMVKQGFVPPGGGDPAAGGAPPGGDPAAAGGAPPGVPPADPAAGGAPPAPSPGIDPMMLQQMVQQQVQQQIAAMGMANPMGGAPGMMGGAAGAGGAKPKGAGKAPDETAQQLYKQNALLMSMCKHIGMTIPDEMFLGPPPGMDMQQAMAQPPQDPNAQQGQPPQDPNAAAPGQPPINVVPSLAMPQAPMPKTAEEENIEAELVRSFGTTFAIADTPQKPMVEVQVPPWANVETPKTANENTGSLQSRASALVALLRASQSA